ncbi:hypothetical protein [Pontixanthobacter aquaemixtae]|uniref:Uncharacterized protein n=1 Tax=Pontixanthobacter aquaemixtae TaxID=1958940 RepID=A0A844ZTV6_9SPHN|nr:hypothetical protein [Pontixanthobacter aquaemixtae]MXO91168.1 hypothetical protein [Pontixanthobacter aquaemixtae]
MGRVPANEGTPWLIGGAWLSLAASLLHILCIFGGEKWYRFFGAGEEIAMAAARGEIWPHIMTLGIAAVLAIWALFAFSGAGKFARLPLLRTALVLISAIYLLRGLALVPLHLWKPELTDAFTFWSSLVVLAYGIAYGVGTWKAWPAMSGGSGR